MSARTIITNSDINKSNLRIREVTIEDASNGMMRVTPLEGGTDPLIPGQRYTGNASAGGRAILVEEIQPAESEG